MRTAIRISALLKFFLFLIHSCIPGVAMSNISTCIRHNRNSSSAQYLVYPDKSLVAVSIPYPSWTSSHLLAHVAHILITEVMDYEAILYFIDTLDDSIVLSSLIGCVDPLDDFCINHDVLDPKIHFTLETWTGGTVWSLSLPEDIRPTLINTMDYVGQDSFFLWQDVVDAALQSPMRMALDHFHTYNASWFKPSIFFDTLDHLLQLVPLNLIVRCSGEDDLGDPYVSVKYINLTGDTAGCTDDDLAWTSLSCRANISECVPVLIQYYPNMIMQLSYFFNMPIAVVMIGQGEENFREYYHAVQHANILFSYWIPDDRLIDSQGRAPVQLVLPRANQSETRQEIFRTGPPMQQIRNYAWRYLAQVDAQVHFFASRINFYQFEMDALMARSRQLKQTGGFDSDFSAERAAACAWVKSHTDRWRAWIPLPCPSGSFLDRSLVNCLVCREGYYCRGGYNNADVCPIGSFCPANCTSPTPCPHGWTTSAPHAISIKNCTQCEYGSFADLVTGSCLTYSVVLPSIIIPLLISLVVVVFVRIRCAAATQDSLIIEVSEITFPVPEVYLGRGSRSIVIKGQHRGTPIAIKMAVDGETTTITHSVFSSLKGGRQPSSRQAMIEMKLLSDVRHPCITTFMGAVPMQQGGFAFVMELMELGSLRDLLQNQMFEYDAEFTLQVLRNISQGMLFIHEAEPPILHRDLKSSNVLVDCNFRAKLSDIKVSEQQGTVLEGKSLLWTAPECLHGRDEYSKASDAYSFGVVLYECLHRRLPYEGKDVQAVLEALYESDGKQHRLRPPKECSVEISALMNECLSFSPAHRPLFSEIDRRLNAITPALVHSAAMTKEEDTRNKCLGWNRAKQIKSIVPAHLVLALGRGEKIPPESKEMVTMYFSDIVGFTDMSASMSAEKVGMMLDRLFGMLDDAAEVTGVTKIETIGDAYLCVSNLHGEHSGDHAARMARFALAAIQVAAATPIDTDDPCKGQVQMRVGLHSGPCIAGIIGKHNPKYTLFGDTINVAARMEQSGRPGKIQCSAFTARLLKSQDASITLEARGLIEVKGKGSMKTFWIIGSKDINGNNGDLHCHQNSNSDSICSEPTTKHTSLDKSASSEQITAEFVFPQTPGLES